MEGECLFAGGENRYETVSRELRLRDFAFGVLRIGVPECDDVQRDHIFIGTRTCVAPTIGTNLFEPTA